MMSSVSSLLKDIFGYLVVIVTVVLLGACGGGGGGGTEQGDTTLPTVISTSPAGGASDIGINTVINIVFSEAMDPTTINASTITLGDSDNNPVIGSVSYSGTTATFTPNTVLAYATTYTATTTTGVEDLAGNALSGNYQFTFTTGNNPDSTAPAVISTNPSATAIDIPVTGTISVTFSEVMDPATVNASTFTLEDDSNIPVTGTVGYSGATATFIPDIDLAYDTTYTATITTGVVDLAGNALATDHTWSFTTEATSTITLNKSGTGSGTVSSVPAGINCGGDCTEIYLSGTDITLTATPDAGSVFEGFSGGCNAISSTCTFTINQDVTVASIFNTLTASAAGNQLGLNGIDDVAVFDQTNTLPETSLDVSTFTIEAWVYPLANQDMLVVADSAYYLMIKPNPLRAEFAVLTSTGFPASASFSGTTRPLQLNQWNHVVGMVDNPTRTLRVALNGDLSAPLVMGGSVNTSFYQLFSIGNSYPTSLGDFPFIGRIDEVRLSSIIRYNIDYSPLSLFVTDADTLGLWHFDETAGSTTFADSSGNGITLNGMNGAATVVGNREVINYVPIANAGSDKNYLTGSTITLDGSESYDLNSDSLTYNWTLSTRPGGSTATLTDANTSSPSFTPDLDGTYIAALVVSDGSLASVEDSVTITAITPGVPAAPLADTGQTTCYDATGNVISCTGTGQDGEYSTSPMSFTDNTDGTISDNITGLMWQKCTAGTNNDATCSGTAINYNWYEASGTYEATYNTNTTDVCGSLNLGGYIDWRLPEIRELRQIVDYSIHSPAIDTTYFPNTIYGIAQSYRALTTSASNINLAWSVNFSDGISITSDATFAPFSYVRCVRGTKPPVHTLLDNSNGTVTDLNTGLMWQQVADDVTRTWEQALTYCAALTLAGQTDWRLPNVRELDSIVDISMYSPAIDSIYFANTNTSAYWSSTSTTRIPSYAYAVSFYIGAIDEITKSTSYLARCVR